MPVAMPRTKATHDLGVHHKACCNDKATIAHNLPSKEDWESTPGDDSISYPSNIDEVPVLDDPRQWSQRRKVGG